MAERTSNHGKIVLLSLVVWLAAHLLLLGALALPDYRACQSVRDSTCSLSVGLTALAVGWIQPFYGVVIALIVQRRHTAVAQGIFIAIGVTTVLFTALCFGGAVGA